MRGNDAIYQALGRPCRCDRIRRRRATDRLSRCRPNTCEQYDPEKRRSDGLAGFHDSVFRPPPVATWDCGAIIPRRLKSWRPCNGRPRRVCGMDICWDLAGLRDSREVNEGDRTTVKRRLAPCGRKMSAGVTIRLLRQGASHVSRVAEIPNAKGAELLAGLPAAGLPSANFLPANPNAKRARDGASARKRPRKGARKGKPLGKGLVLGRPRGSWFRACVLLPIGAKRPFVSLQP